MALTIEQKARIRGQLELRIPFLTAFSHFMNLLQYDLKYKKIDDSEIKKIAELALFCVEKLEGFYIGARRTQEELERSEVLDAPLMSFLEAMIIKQIHDVIEETFPELKGQFKELIEGKL